MERSWHWFPLVTIAFLCLAGARAGESPLAQPEGKPPCTEAIVGHQWPEEAADPIFAAALAPYGYPMLCTHTQSGYVWRSLRARANS